MRRFAAAADGNQKSIVQALRDVGATVAPCHMVGAGFPDLVVGFRGVNYMIEVKDPMQPKHRHELTPAQVDFHRDWQGKISIAFTVSDALQIIGAVKSVPFRGQIS